MKKLRQILCLVLFVCLLAGCAPSSSASAAQSLSVAQGSSISSSAQSSTPAAPSWQQAFYNAAQKQLARQDGSVLSSIDFLYTPAGPPIMLLHMQTSGGGSQFSIWKMQSGTALMTSSGSKSPYGVRYENGLPVYSEESGAGGEHVLIYEQNGAQKNHLYHYTYNGYYQWVLYTYADDKTWEWREIQEKDPVGQLQILNCYSTTNNLTLILPEDSGQKQQLLEEFFLQTYQPPVPQQAPAWVADYVRFLRIQNAWAPDAQVDLQQTLWREGITLLDPLWENGPPLLFGVFEDEVYYCLFEDGMHSFGSMPEDTHHFYHDADGNTLIQFEGGVAGYYAHWYGVSPSGTTLLFNEGGDLYDEYDGELYLYNENFLYSGDDERSQANTWISEKRDEMFTGFGYKPPLTLYTKTNYTLPQNTTWAQLEGELIAALCTYIKQIGQWS